MIKIDTMKQSDLSQIQELYRALLPEGCPMKELLGNYMRICQDERYAMIVVREGEEILGTSIGIICIALDTPFMVVENVVVREYCRGKGVGRMIFEELDRFALEHDCGYAILASSGFRKNAHKFYEAVGYDDDVRGFRKVY